MLISDYRNLATQTVSQMREKIGREMPVLFDAVLDGFSKSASSNNKELLRASERHLFLFVRLCEWAQSTKTLSSCGIKNTATSHRNSAHVLYKDAIPTMNINTAIHNGVDVALCAYDRTVSDLYDHIHKDTLDYGQLKVITKACLDTLMHITELCRIAEYTCRRTAHGDSVNNNGQNTTLDKDTVKNSEESLAENLIEDLAENLKGVCWESLDRKSATVHFKGLKKDHAHALACKVNQPVLWLAYIDIYIDNVYYKSPSGI